MVVVRSTTTLNRSPAGCDACSCGSSCADAVDRVDDVGAGLPENDHQHRRLAVDEAGRRGCPRPSPSTVADVGEPNGARRCDTRRSSGRYSPAFNS